MRFKVKKWVEFCVIKLICNNYNFFISQVFVKLRVLWHLSVWFGHSSCMLVVLPQRIAWSGLVQASNADCWVAITVFHRVTGDFAVSVCGCVTQKHDPYKPFDLLLAFDLIIVHFKRSSAISAVTRVASSLAVYFLMQNLGLAHLSIVVGNQPQFEEQRINTSQFLEESVTLTQSVLGTLLTGSCSL